MEVNPIRDEKGRAIANQPNVDGTAPVIPQQSTQPASGTATSQPDQYQRGNSGGSGRAGISGRVLGFGFLAIVGAWSLWDAYIQYQNAHVAKDLTNAVISQSGGGTSPSNTPPSANSPNATNRGILQVPVDGVNQAVAEGAAKLNEGASNSVTAAAAATRARLQAQMRQQTQDIQNEALKAVLTFQSPSTPPAQRYTSSPAKKSSSFVSPTSREQMQKAILQAIRNRGGH